MKNVGEIIDKMDEIKKIQSRLENGTAKADDIDGAVELLDEFIAILRSVKVVT